MTYLENTLLAQSFYARILKNEANMLWKEGKTKELLAQQEEMYKLKIERGNTDVNNVDYKIKKLREDLHDIMTQKNINAYIASDFVGKIAKLDYLEQVKVIQEKKQKEEDCVKETFGELYLDDIRNPKTQNELIDERNERLAILYNLKSNGKLDDDAYNRNVVAVRRVYERSIKTALVEDVKKVDFNNKSHFKKLKNILQKIKNIFKIGKPTLDIENEIGKSSVVKEYAVKALAEVGGNLLSSESEIKQEEAMECLKDACSISASIPDIKLSDKANEIVDNFFKDEIAKQEKTAYTDSKRSKEDKIDSYKSFMADERLHFTSIFNNSGYIKDKITIDIAQSDMENYIIKNFKHTKKTTGSLNNGINVEFIFEDANVQKAYDELQTMFKVQKESRQKNVEAKKELDEKTKEIQNIKENNNTI